MVCVYIYLYLLHQISQIAFLEKYRKIEKDPL